MSNFFSGKWSFDENEKKLIQYPPRSTSSYPRTGKTLLIQTPSDYYFLSLFGHAIAELKKKNNDNVVGLWPTILVVKQRRDLLFPIRLAYSWINSFLLKRKWAKLYQVIGVETLETVADVPFVKRIKFFSEAFRIWMNLKSKEELLALHLNGIYCGDLIGDTYLRYRIRPSISIRSLSTLYYIYLTLCAIESSERLASKKNISLYLTSYATYIQHGIPVRVFLKKGITVYSSGNLQQRFKKLSIDDHFHTAAHKNYFQTFKTLDDQPGKIALGHQMLENKFKGVIDRSTSYMKSSAFDEVTGHDDEKLNFDGVLFLHDFYDSPHVYSSMLFADFYEWADHTFRLIEKNKLNIGIKPHPNQTEESKRDIKKLKRAFPSLQWIEPSTSNLKIFGSGIKFGISIYGTVLHELAYHGINPICAGDNPHASFDFIHRPETIVEYDRLILNANDLRLPLDYKDKVASFFYMHNVYSKEDYPVDETLFRGQSVYNANSELFKKVLDKMSSEHTFS